MTFIKRFLFVAAVSTAALGTTAVTVFAPTPAYAQTYTAQNLIDLLQVRIDDLIDDRTLIGAAINSNLSNSFIVAVLSSEVQLINSRIANLESIQQEALAGNFTDAEIDDLYELYLSVFSPSSLSS